MVGRGDSDLSKAAPNGHSQTAQKETDCKEPELCFDCCLGFICDVYTRYARPTSWMLMLARCLLYTLIRTQANNTSFSSHTPKSHSSKVNEEKRKK